MQHLIERRLTTHPVEVRAADSGKPVIRGYAAKFDLYSHDLGGFVERVRPSAFTKTLQELDDLVAVHNHSEDRLWGRLSSGTARVGVDETGLWYEADAPDTTWARDLITQMARGDIRGSSFKFRVITDDWSKVTEHGDQLRDLLEVSLKHGDVSTVVNPAYPDATSEVGKRALTRLAEQRSLPVEAVIDAAERHELRSFLTSAVDLASGGAATADETRADGTEAAGPGTTPTPRLTVARARLDLAGRATHA